MNLRIFDTHEDLHQALARTIVQRALDGEESKSIALSGGKSPVPLYEMLGRGEWREELGRREIVWVVVDERYVPFDHPDSNAGMMQRTLFADGLSPSHQFLPFRTGFAKAAESAEQFETEWRETGIADLDLVLLGVGDDGHTASLFPGTPVLGVEDRIASDVFEPRLDAWRVTITRPVIRAAKLRIVLATGESKKRILQGVREGVDYPITQVTAGDIETWWFVDREAAPE
jgi:6-phosphogluconolactonase